MARIKIPLPESFPFSALIPIRITDLNYGGHVGNDTILSLLHEARIQFLRNLDYSELNFQGAGLIMRDVAIEFRSELFYGSSIRAHVAAAEFTPTGFDIFYKLVDEKDERLVVLAKTGMVCFDYQKRKVVAVPSEAVTRLGGRP